MSAPLDLRAQLQGANLLVFGGTGFLGKVWVSMLLARCPGIGRIHLVVRRKGDLSPEERFWAEIAPSEAFDPLRALHPGPGYEAFLREKVDPVGGDVCRDVGGVSEEDRRRLRGAVTAIVNVAGVVDFTPPLDTALDVNAFGMKRLVALARDLGDVPFLHTSTCYVAGLRTGQVDEVDPRQHPFPRFGELEGLHWDPEREIAECADIVEMVRHRADDAFRQADFRDQARKALRQKGEPERGAALEDELARVRRRYVEGELAGVGAERANFWGWPNTYTYTKSLGEQVLLDSGLRCAIVRPAVVESALGFPRTGWNEGITTSAPIMYLSMKGMTGMPATDDAVLDIVPVDCVAAGMTLALAELLEGTHRPLYQLGTSDTNPFTMHRLIELTGLYKRRKYRGQPGKDPIYSWLMSRYETVPVSVSGFRQRGPRQARDALKGVSGLLRRAAKAAPLLEPLAEPAAAGVDGLAGLAGGIDKVVDQYVPFTATHNYRFSTANVRRASARVVPEQRDLFPWAVDYDWRHYWLEVHVPGVERLVWPLIEDKLKRPKAPLRSWDHLLDLLDEVADRFDHAPALLVRHGGGFAHVSCVALRDRARAAAQRLIDAGVRPGDRVVLSGANHPDWVVAYFGILGAGGVAVPLDPGLEEADVQRLLRASGARVAALGRCDFACSGPTTFDLEALTAEGPMAPLHRPAPDAPASVLFTSGTTGTPKGVVLTHRNFTAMLGSLGRLFQLGPGDRVLSVLPLHHTFEFSCGLLLPLSQGARIVYLDEVSAEALSSTLKDARVTAMVGVPALWQLLERRIAGQVQERGGAFQAVFDAGMELNRLLGRQAGIDLGRLLFGAVHEGLGGNIRLLISGGAALPPETHRFFAGLGLPLSEGYGLTEAAPVLAVSAARPGSKAGSVGTAVPGVELRIDAPDEHGVGEVLARGPNVMAGYWDNPEATAGALTDDGWLRTGDLGTLDHRGRLTVVGRAKDVVVTASGENIYLDDVEARLGAIADVREYCLVGLPDPSGGERLGLLAVAEHAANGGHDAAKAGLRAALSALPPHARPSVVHLVDADLPRTATRKVKRAEVSGILARIAEAAAPAIADDDRGHSAVRRAIARVGNVPLERVTGATHITGELAFDSLMWVELAAALDDLPGGHPAAEALARCETVAEIEALVDAPPAPRAAAIEDVERVPFRFPAALVPSLKGALRQGQRAIYEELLDVDVIGRAHIPHNRPVLVVSNHASHLDFGLVKTALGPYGERMVGLAAKDYFFEGPDWWVACFDQLTNLRPLSRGANFRQSLRDAAGVVREGHVVCIFPEGGRVDDGSLQDFKPLVGKLVLETGVDVLPMYLDGSHAVLPKGAFVPKGRRVRVRIGPVLEHAELRRLTAGERPGKAARGVTQVLHRAVAALRDGSSLQLSDLDVAAIEAPLRPSDPVADLFAEIPGRFVPGGLDRRICWYFSLGEDRWTVTADASSATVRRGRPEGAADCVVKTNAALWTRMVREAHAPDPSDFIGGAIKTSDLNLLMAFAQGFRLGPAAPAPEARL